MNLFSSKKPKMKVKRLKNEDLLSIDYFKIKNFEVYKLDLLKKLMGSGACVAIMNTDVMYEDQKRMYAKAVPKLIEGMSSFNINYKKYDIKRKNRTTVLGMQIRQNNDEYYEDFIVVMALNENTMEKVKQFLNLCNMQYYIIRKSSVEDALGKVEVSINQEVCFNTGYDFKIYDDMFMRNLNISISESSLETPDSIAQLMGFSL